MTFVVAAEAYDRFMGRYSAPLAPVFADFAGVADGQRVLDVGCGPGALTAELVRRLGPASVTAVDPSEPFVAAARERHPDVRVERASAEDLPFPDGTFDAALAQLVVHFMTDPVAGLHELARVTREKGVVGCLRLGSRRGRTRPTLRVLGGCERDRSRAARTSPRSPGHVRATSRSSSTLRASAPSRRLPSP